MNISVVRRSSLHRPSMMAATTHRLSLVQGQEEDTTENYTNTQITTSSNVEYILSQHTVVLITENFSEAAGRCRSVRKIISNLGVGETTAEFNVLPLDARPVDGPAIGKFIAQVTGYTNVPILFIDGVCVGDYKSILNQARSGHLRTKLIDAGIRNIVSAIPSATLEANIYGYPKALNHGQEGNRRNDLSAPLNVLIGACGSSASDKIPTLVETCVAKGWAVKLICTNSGEHFFKTFGMQRILNSIGADNVYRDEDEWSFEYDKFDMPVRACHLALRKWADVMVVGKSCLVWIYSYYCQSIDNDLFFLSLSTNHMQQYGQSCRGDW